MFQKNFTVSDFEHQIEFDSDPKINGSWIKCGIADFNECGDFHVDGIMHVDDSDMLEVRCEFSLVQNFDYCIEQRWNDFIENIYNGRINSDYNIPYEIEGDIVVFDINGLID